MAIEEARCLLPTDHLLLAKMDSVAATGLEGLSLGPLQGWKITEAVLSTNGRYLVSTIASPQPDVPSQTLVIDLINGKTQIVGLSGYGHDVSDQGSEISMFITRSTDCIDVPENSSVPVVVDLANRTVQPLLTVTDSTPLIGRITRMNRQGDMVVLERNCLSCQIDGYPQLEVWRQESEGFVQSNVLPSSFMPSVNSDGSTVVFFRVVDDLQATPISWNPADDRFLVIDVPKSIGAQLHVDDAGHRVLTHSRFEIVTATLHGKRWSPQDAIGGDLGRVVQVSASSDLDVVIIEHFEPTDVEPHLNHTVMQLKSKSRLDLRAGLNLPEDTKLDVHAFGRRAKIVAAVFGEDPAVLYILDLKRFFYD